MQLQQFPGIVLVRLFPGIRPAVRSPIQIPEHGRTQRRGTHHGGNAAQGMGANHVAFVGGFEPPAVTLGTVDVEVIAPELHHGLMQLAAAERGPQQPTAGEGVEHDRRLVLEQLPHREFEYAQASQRRLGPLVVQSIGRELLPYVGRDRVMRRTPQGAHAGILPRAGTVRQA